MQGNARRTVVSWVAVFAFVALCVAILAWRQSSRDAETKAAAAATSTPVAVLTVKTARVQMNNLPEVVTATGTVGAKDPLEIAAEANGLKVEQVLVEEGDSVYAGQTLVVLNRTVLEAQLAQAQARLRSSEAQISKAIQPNRPQDVQRLRAALSEAQAMSTQEEANVRQAESVLRQAEETSQRYQQVHAQGFVTAQEASERLTAVQQSRAGLSAARQRLTAARFNAEAARQQLSLGLAGGRAEDVEIARSTAQEMRASIQQLEAQLEQTVLRAPDNGWVLTRNVRLGEISSSSKVMFTLARRSELELRAEIPQDRLTRLRTDLRAEVTYADKKTSGRIWQISPTVDSKTRLGTARIMLQPGSELKPGIFAEAHIAVGQHRALTVPVTAVLGEGGSYFVFKLEGTNVKQQAVQTGLRNNQVVEIVKGLSANDSVVVEGGSLLNDGDKVTIAP